MLGSDYPETQTNPSSSFDIANIGPDEAFDAPTRKLWLSDLKAFREDDWKRYKQEQGFESEEENDGEGSESEGGRGEGDEAGGDADEHGEGEDDEDEADREQKRKHADDAAEGDAGVVEKGGQSERRELGGES